MRKTYSNAMRFKWRKGALHSWSVYDVKSDINYKVFFVKDEAIRESKIFNNIYHLGRQDMWEESNKNAQRIMDHLGL